MKPTTVLDWLKWDMKYYRRDNWHLLINLKMAVEWLVVLK